MAIGCLAYFWRLSVISPPISMPPSLVVVSVISSPLMVPLLVNFTVLPPMSTLTLKEILSPSTLPSAIGIGSVGPVTVPVNLSPSCLNV